MDGKQIADLVDMSLRMQSATPDPRLVKILERNNLTMLTPEQGAALSPLAEDFVIMFMADVSSAHEMASYLLAIFSQGISVGVEYEKARLRDEWMVD